jgi:hypothetical protein
MNGTPKLAKAVVVAVVAVVEVTTIINSVVAWNLMMQTWTSVMDLATHA